MLSNTAWTRGEGQDTQEEEEGMVKGGGEQGGGRAGGDNNDEIKEKIIFNDPKDNLEV